MTKRLAHKIALVTGGSTGMGYAIASRFIDQGAKVAICSNDQDGLSEAVKKLASQGEVIGEVADVSSADDMQRFVAKAVSHFGGVDILANCAGVQRYGTVVDTSIEIWDEVMAVNLKGIFLSSKYAIPAMTERGGGAIINIASVQAYASQSNVAAYTASKGAILALTRAMALDHIAAGIRVNVICPASIDTPMLRGAADKWKGANTAQQTLDAWGKGHPIGRIGKADEVATVAVFLACEESSFVTGADIKVDGGVLSKLGIVLPE